MGDIQMISQAMLQVFTLNNMFMILIGIFVVLWGYCVFYSRTGGIKEKIVRK